MWGSVILSASLALSWLAVTPANHCRVYFYRACMSYTANDKLNTLKYCTQVLDSFTPVPRYQHIAGLMYDEAAQWADGDVADVGRDMRISGDRLARGLGDLETQQVQKRVIDKLDKLINELNKPPDSSVTQSPDKSAPLPDSKPVTEQADGKVIEQYVKQLYPNWGTMPPLERAQAIQELSLRSPLKWKEMIDSYNKSLNKRVP